MKKVVCRSYSPTAFQIGDSWNGWLITGRHKIPKLIAELLYDGKTWAFTGVRV